MLYVAVNSVIPSVTGGNSHLYKCDTAYFLKLIVSSTLDIYFKKKTEKIIQYQFYLYKGLINAMLSDLNLKGHGHVFVQKLFFRF